MLWIKGEKRFARSRIRVILVNKWAISDIRLSGIVFFYRPYVLTTYENSLIAIIVFGIIIRVVSSFTTAAGIENTVNFKVGMCIVGGIAFHM